MDTQKTALKLMGDMCLDDSDKNMIMIWSKAVTMEDEELLVCWQVSDPGAEELKDMVSEWNRFVVLTAKGRPLGNAADFFLIK